MKNFKSVIAISLVCLFCCTGCASFDVFSSTVQADLTAFQQWADKWVGGVVAEAPALLAAVSPLVKNSTLVNDATAAIAAAQGAVSVVDAIGIGANANTAAATQASVVQAFNNVNSTIASVKAVIATKQ